MTVEAAAALRVLQSEAASAASPSQATQSAGVALGGGAGGVAEGPEFASVLADIAASNVRTLATGEAAALAGLQGGASVQQVVSAVMSAEQTLQAAIAIRDKVVAAYQEITRMAI